WVPAGMEGVCNPATWTESDHRPTTRVEIYRMKVAGATDAPLNDLVKNGTIKLEKVKTIDLPRKPEWLGGEPGNLLPLKRLTTAGSEGGGSQRDSPPTWVSETNFSLLRA